LTPGSARAPLSVTALLDETVDVVAAAAPWSAIPIAAALPYRFLQVLFVERLLDLGDDARHYAHALGRLATLTILAFVVSLLARAVWLRICGLAHRRAAIRTADALRVPPAALLSYLFTSALLTALLHAIWITVIAIPLLVLVGGLAAGTMELNERPSLLEPLRLIRRHSKHARILLALLFVFAIAVGAAAANLYACFAAALWLAHAFATADLARWNGLLGFGNSHFVLLLVAGALAAVEPFWLAANVLVVRNAGAAESGDDLRQRLEELLAR
jgi:hypothetical protein